ncbi:hypothetical protein, partial [Oceanispirochaeta sp.]|uniref:hypothetical protein n=1 Tax=Oceanispirochaeta sp. TaxID=2035350 RepID=UPI00262195AA
MKRCSKPMKYLLLIVFLISPVWVFGIAWDGSVGDNRWDSGLNWVGDAVPPAGADVEFPIDANIISSNVVPTIGILTISAGANVSLVLSNPLGLTMTTTSIDGSLTTSVQDLDAGDVILAGISSINTTGQNFDATSISGGSDFTLTSGAGIVNITGAIGTVPLGDFTIVTSGGITTNSTINATSVDLTSAGNVSLGGAVTVPGGFTSAGVTFTSLGLDSSGGLGGISINHTGNVTLNGPVVSDSGDVTLNSDGILTLNQSVSSTSGALDFTSVGITNVGADTTTGGTGSVTYNDNVTLTASVNVNSTGTGDVDFLGTLNGTTASVED